MGDSVPTFNVRALLDKVDADGEPLGPATVGEWIQRMRADIPASQWLREDHVARRMTLEREARGWSQEVLARRVRAQGFYLPQSAISRIENPPEGSTRRAVGLNEAIALSVVFDIPLEVLLSPPSPYGLKAIEDVVAGAELARHYNDARRDFDEAVTRVATQLVNHPADFGPLLAREVARLLDAAGVDRAVDLDEAIRATDPADLEAPARYQLMFLKAALSAAGDMKGRTRGPRPKGKS